VSSRRAITRKRDERKIRANKTDSAIRLALEEGLIEEETRPFTNSRGEARTKKVLILVEPR
jgi:hypothetical protein